MSTLITSAIVLNNLAKEDLKELVVEKLNFCWWWDESDHESAFNPYRQKGFTNQISTIKRGTRADDN